MLHEICLSSGKVRVEPTQVLQSTSCCCQVPENKIEYWLLSQEEGDNDNDNGLAGVTAMAQSPTTFAVVAVEPYAPFRTNIIEIV